MKALGVEHVDASVSGSCFCLCLLTSFPNGTRRVKAPGGEHVDVLAFQVCVATFCAGFWNGTCQRVRTFPGHVAYGLDSIPHRIHICITNETRQRSHVFVGAFWIGIWVCHMSQARATIGAILLLLFPAVLLTWVEHKYGGCRETHVFHIAWALLLLPVRT